MQQVVDSFPQLAWIRDVFCDLVGMVQFFGSNDGIMIDIVGFAKGSEVCKARQRFPFVFQFAAGFLEDFECWSEPRV